MRVSALVVVGCLSSFFVQADNVSINLSSDIELQKLYADSISNVHFDPNVLTLEVNTAQTGFAPAKSDLHIETTIPRAQSSIAYNIKLEDADNKAACYDIWDAEYPQAGFTTVLLDGTPLTSVGVDILDFTDDDGTSKTAKHVVTFQFQPFSAISGHHPAVKCSGSVELTVGISI